jgi:hypothetical protein
MRPSPNRQYIWITFAATIMGVGCAPLAGLQVYEAVEARRKINAYDQLVAEGQAPARSLIWDCNQTAMTRRSPKNDGSWDIDPAVRTQCFHEKGWEQTGPPAEPTPFGTWRRLGAQ